MIEPASVIGLVFAEAAVEALAPETIRPSASRRTSSALPRKQLVRPDRGDGDDDERLPLPPRA